MDRRTRRLALRFGVLALAGLLYFGGQWLENNASPGLDPERGRDTSQGSGITVEQAYARRLSDVMVQTDGTVDRTLRDDNDGSRHQRFIIETASGTTVLVAHNIDLAKRVPLREGDQVEILGEYEWNDQGGVLHWTHHDPQGRRPGGWIRHQGREYR
jgi:hypothetical protein